MLSIVINLVALIYGLRVSTSPHKRYLSIVVFYFFLTDWFYTANTITGGVAIVKTFDFCVVYGLLLYLMQKKSNTAVPKNKYENFLIYFILFHLFIFLLTIILKREDFSYAIKVGRMFLIYLLYFPLKMFTLVEIRKSLKVIFIIELIYGITFFLQYMGIYVLASYEGLKEVGNGLYRYTNVPNYFLFFLIYLTISEQKNKFSYFLIVYLGAMLVLPMSRMRILFFCIVIFYYFFFMKKQYGKMLKVGLVAMLVGLALSPYLLARVEGGDNSVSMKEDLLFAFENRDYTNYNVSDAGTLGFRISMLLERIEYMAEHPQYALTGVGFLHELSPNCYKNFHFILGTWNENYPNGKGELTTVDIQWVQILMQMGYLGVILYLCYMFVIASFLYKKRKDSLCCAGYLYVLIFIFGSVTESVWTNNPSFILLISLLMSYTNKIENTTCLKKLS